MKRTLISLLTLAFFVSAQAAGQNASPLAEGIQRILNRPEFRHANFGIEFYDLDRHESIYALNTDKLFTPASTTKLLTEGTALALLGADYRFHTRVYRTGPVINGVLNGDLILVASGDPNLSGRIQPNGTLVFENEDHSYAGSPDTRAVPGDPLLVINDLARQVAAKGIRRAEGHVIVDASLFGEGQREQGTGVVISPIVVNDNIVDVTVGPGAAAGQSVTLQISPPNSYVRFVNQATTAAAGSQPEIHWRNDTQNNDGSHTVSVVGSFPLGMQPILFAYAVPQPTRFAEFVFAEALRKAGATADITLTPEAHDFKVISASYTPENVVAEHTSPPLAEEVKVTLKVSQNLHASMTPYLLGALVAHTTSEIDQAGFNAEHDFLARAGLDLSGASQADGAGGARSAFYTPDFMVHYLEFMSKQKDYEVFLHALPILGRDGTLWNIQPNSAAAGHVFAKTGTYGAYDALNRDLMVTGKGLAGYMTTNEGRHLAFAIYANHVAVPREDPEATTKIVGQALGEIAAVAYNPPAGARSRTVR
jgi:D-alanyl-D-alanine carboxypeptidase/D-alanyl-D-alanine-endopeptidase (penicillin-binding protein 4)